MNLAWAVDRVLESDSILEEALKIYEEDQDTNRAMGKHGVAIISDGDTILTHCNAGALATAGYGTALGVFRAAAEMGKTITVFADETRPYLQGARLTAWELIKENIPVIVITDNMAGHFLHSGQIDIVVVGADRIAANGDTANKIGTYSVAVLAKENGVPFYVAAPLSTVDLASKTGADIPIEERPSREVTHVRGRQITPNGVKVHNTAFDVTPNKYVAAIITDEGVARKPFTRELKKLFGK